MGDSNHDFKLEISNENCQLLSAKLAAINNPIRFAILEILKRHQKGKGKEPLYSREINLILNDYGINITPQMLGQHLKILIEADLIEMTLFKKEIPNKIGMRNVKSYIMKENAFENFFLQANFLSDEILSFFKLYEMNKKLSDGNSCVLTVFNGIDKGKTFKIGKDETAIIGRACDSELINGLKVISIDDSYSTVSKNHLKLFYEDGNWKIMDDGSLYGTFVDDNLVFTNKSYILRDGSFIKLSKYKCGVVFYCSF